MGSRVDGGVYDLETATMDTDVAGEGGRHRGDDGDGIVTVRQQENLDVNSSRVDGRGEGQKASELEKNFRGGNGQRVNG